MTIGESLLNPMKVLLSAMHDSDIQGIPPTKTSCLENKLAEKIVQSEDGINRAFEAMVTKNLSSRVFEFRIEAAVTRKDES